MGYAVPSEYANHARPFPKYAPRLREGCSLHTQVVLQSEINHQPTLTPSTQSLFLKARMKLRSSFRVAELTSSLDIGIERFRVHGTPAGHKMN